MPRHDIHSLNDPALAVYRDLKQSNLTRYSGRFIAEGEKVVLRLLESDFCVESVLAAESHVHYVLPLLEARPATTLFVAPDILVPQIVGFNFHRGLLACGIRKPSPNLASLCGNDDRALRLVVCPDVQGPDNLGQIIRTSCALGINSLITGPLAGDPFSRRVLRVSMGAAFSLPIYESHELAADLARLRDENRVHLIATVLDDSATPIDRFDCPRRAAILLGSEGHGLSPDLIDVCDHRLTIPMHRNTDSLNVAVAAGIVLHHFAAVSKPSGTVPIFPSPRGGHRP